MTIRIGDIAPNFTQQSSIGELDFHSAIEGSWALLFSHPRNYTAVCTTEFGSVAQLKPEFDRRGVKLVGLSVDAPETHDAWAEDIERIFETEVDFPVIADTDASVSVLYDMLVDPVDKSHKARSIFVIDPLKKIRFIAIYPEGTGRNYHEVLRVIDSLQLTSSQSVLTPANWHPGEDAVIPTRIQDPEELQRLFPQGFRTVTPYLRFVSTTER